MALSHNDSSAEFSPFSFPCTKPRQARNFPSTLFSNIANLGKIVFCDSPFMIKRSLIVLMLLSQLLIADDLIKLKSDQILYDETQRLLIAKGNIELSYNDIKIIGSQLNIDVDTHYVWSTSNVLIQRKDNQFNSSSFFMDLQKEHIKLNNINIIMRPPENRGNLYLTSKILIDTPRFKIGSHGKATTCDLHSPHHFIWAQKYKYIPNKRITMYNVVFYNKILFIPIVLWTPFYTYHLGERNIVWNFPVIGKKERPGWGWFIQNTIDYKRSNNKDSSLYVDWFQHKGIGYGIKHHYQKGGLDGFIYGYNFNFEENAVEKSNKIFKWHNSFSPNDKLTISNTYHRADVDERINSTGSENNESNDLHLKYNDLGNYYHTHYRTYSDKKESNKNTQQRFSLERRFNHEDRYRFNFSEQKIFQTKRRTQTAHFYRNFIFPNEYQWQTNLSLNRLDSNWEDHNVAIDDQLYVTSTLTKPLTKYLSMRIYVQQLYDLDEDRVTADIVNNNYLYKEPELTFSLNNLHYKTVQFTQTTTIARYRETRYDSTTLKQRQFPQPGQFSIYPNTYIFKQKLSQHVQIPFKGSLSSNLEYNQYTFKVPNKALFNGDNMYHIKFNTTHIATWLPFAKTNTRLSTSFIDNDNNSPFYSINKLNHEEKQLTETVTFFYTKRYKNQFPYYFNINWSHATGINWISQNRRWNDYLTRLRVDVTRRFNTSVSTGRKLNNFTETNKYLPLNIQVNLTPRSFKLNYQVAFNLNKWINDGISQVQSSRFTLSTIIGKKQKKEYRWEIKSTFTYNTLNTYNQSYALSNYELQSIHVVKHEHKRKLMVGYNKPNKEITIQYQFNAFPDDPIKLRKNRNGWKVEGRFNQSSVERFN